MTYGFSARMDNKPFDEVVTQVTAALREEGFGVLSDLDIQAAMREKLGATMPRYRILGACNPPLAHSALQAEPDIGLLLPCNVVVREDAEGQVTVSFIDPDRMVELVHKPEIDDVAREAKERLQRVRDRLLQ
ncbi:DUF302 domain-containing protein [Aquabacterium sp. A7-Y]|uniref:DUF302 domain-containing protein n=1 Tax=Aquabacterium sp. A7-Y TaxID=1349605 RepID=UPI00223C8EF5|nr:DUF302 domain-containing protein [Aquabacterium sp. A7-Y]MCW7541393.1 DUF302 domain-containing protein [Aquabacterium sp. A7-Y]